MLPCGITWPQELTHWGQVIHICIHNLTIIVSNNGLSPYRRQAIIWTNAWVLSIGPLETNLRELSIEIWTFSFTGMHFKMSSAMSQTICFSSVLPCGITWRQELTHWGRVIHICINNLSLFQIIACRQIGHKPLSELMLEYCKLDPLEQT